jgi:hypothetical protein
LLFLYSKVLSARINQLIAKANPPPPAVVPPTVNTTGSNVNSPQLNRTPSLHAMSIAGKTMEFESNNPLARYSPNRKGSSSNLTAESPKNIRSQMTYGEVMEEDKQKTPTTASSEEKEQQQKNIAALEEIKRKRIAEEEAANFSAAIISQEQEKQRQRKAAEDDEMKRKAAAAEKAAAEERERQRRADEEEKTLQERNRQAAEKALALAAAKERQRKAAEEDETKTKAAAAEKQAFEENERQRKAEEEEKKRTATEKTANEAKERQRKAAEEEESKRKIAAEQETKRIATEKAANEEKERLEKVNSEPVTPITTGVTKPASMAVELLSEKVSSDNRPSSSVRASSIDDGFGDSISTLFIPAVSVEPIPGVVIKTKREDGTKIFVNVCHHSVIPVLNGENAYMNHPFYSDYLQLYFTQFTLNKMRYVMHVAPLRETADKDGGTCFVSDVTVHSSVFEECSKDNDLCDKVSVIPF